MARRSGEAGIPIGARGPYGAGSSSAAREQPAGHQCVDEFIYLSFHKIERTGARMPPCTLRLFDNAKVEFVGVGRRKSSGLHGWWERHVTTEDPGNYQELRVCFHWAGDNNKAKLMTFMLCPGQSHLWQSVADSLANAVVLVRTTPLEAINEQFRVRSF